MIRYRILQLDSPELLGFAKRRIDRLVVNGVAAVRRYPVNGALVLVRTTRVAVDEWYGTIRIEGTQKTKTTLFQMPKRFTPTPLAPYAPAGVAVPELAFSDDTEADGETVVGVHAAPVYKKCSVATSTAALSTFNITESILSTLYDGKHGYILAGYVQGLKLLVRSPSDMRDMLHEYVELRWYAQHFWKNEKGEVMVLCTCNPRVDSAPFELLDASDSIYRRAMPYTEATSYLADKYVADDLVALDVAEGKALRTPPTVHQLLPYVFLTARLIDLINAQDARSVSVRTAAATYFVTYFGRAYPFDLPAGSDGEVLNLVRDYDTPDYKMTVTVSGTWSLVDGVRTFTGQAFISSFRLARTVWVSEARGSVFEYDVTGTSNKVFTDGDTTPFEKATLVDGRALFWPENPAYIPAPGREILYNVVHNVSASGRAYDFYTRVTAQLETDYFAGVSFMLHKYEHNEVVVLGLLADFVTPALPVVSSRLVQHHVGQYAAKEITLDTPELIGTKEQVASDRPVFAPTDTVEMYQEHRGEPLLIGEYQPMDVDNPSIGQPPYQGWFTFVVDDALTELGVAGECAFHLGTKYVEIYPSPISESLSVPTVPIERWFNGVRISDDTYPDAALFDGRFLPPTLPYSSLYSGAVVPGVFGLAPVVRYEYYDMRREVTWSRVGTITRLAAIEYPEAYYFSATHKNESGVDTVYRYPAVAIYYPNLKPAVDGFCLMKQAPAAASLAIRSLHAGAASSATLTAWRVSLAVLRVELERPEYAEFPLFRSAVNDVSFKSASMSATSEQDAFDTLRALTLTALRASYVVVANNFAPPALMDIVMDDALILADRPP